MLARVFCGYVPSISYINQSWIFKSFSYAAADGGIDATHKIAIFKQWFSGWFLDHMRITGIDQLARLVII